MRCPICSSPLREGATKCDECGCGILPPPPSGVEPTPFARAASAPKWPLVLSIVGVVAALAVIAVALLPLFDNNDDTTVSTATSVTDASGAAASTSAPLSSSDSASGEATSAPTTVPATTSPSTSSPTTTSASSGSSSSSSAPSTTAAAASTSAGPVFPAPAIVAVVEATCTAPDSTDSRGNRITFNPLLTVDGVPDTAWRCPGDSIHEALLYTLARPSDISAVAAIPGYAGADPFNGSDRFDQNRRVLKARWACFDATGKETASVEQTFTNERRMQGTTVTNFKQCAKVVFEVLDSSAPGNRDYTAVSEIGIYGPA